MLAKQVLYHLSHTYLEKGGSHELFAGGWPRTLILPISASQVARVTCVSHQSLA
jgi:hypothetical protein